MLLKLLLHNLELHNLNGDPSLCPTAANSERELTIVERGNDSLLPDVVDGSLLPITFGNKFKRVYKSKRIDGKKSFGGFMFLGVLRDNL